MVIAALVVFFYYGSRNVSERKINLPKISTTQTNDIPQTSIVAENLEIPWALAFFPDGNILVTERPGRVKLVDENGNAELISEIKGVKHIGEGGLLGIAIHPDFSLNNYVYLYYTYESSGNDTLNRVVRMTYKENSLSDEKIIVDKIPGASNHNGGRIKFGPDRFLYITTGDAQNPSLSQNKNSLAGKILRVTDEGKPFGSAQGKPAPGNPFGTLIYSYGHRNPQGLAWNGNELYSTEHGSATMDELNRITPGKNYGWPEIRGDDKQSGMEKPLLHSGSDTWAPSGAAFWQDRLFFAGLRGEALFELDTSSLNLKAHFKGEFGRIRDVVLGPDNMLYITTSNHDGRGFPRTGDDKIIRINPAKL